MRPSWIQAKCLVVVGSWWFVGGDRSVVPYLHVMLSFCSFCAVALCRLRKRKGCFGSIVESIGGIGCRENMGDLENFITL